MPRMATPREAYDAIIGSGALSFGWYIAAHTEGKIDDDWKATIQIVDPDDDDEMKTFIVTHQIIIDTARNIAAMLIPNTSTACDNECHNLLYASEWVDFDASTADELLQTIAFGCVIFC